ncbi:MAG: radical SAM protein [Spirochaetota bacterium]|nr:MAG: radical SAM protein [Spirochaetota bacterium]
MKINAKSKKALAKISLQLMKVDFIMNLFLKWGEKQILKNLVLKNPRNRPIGAQEDKAIAVRNLMKIFEKKYREGSLSPAVKDWVFNRLVGDIILNWAERHPEAAERRRRDEPLPVFMTISPTQECNLACFGCYAASSKKTLASLDWDIVDKLIDQKRELWGSYFTVISGGEPLMWESQGKNIIDLYEKHDDNFFLMYTNGTMIDRSVAKKFGELGNITPAISVEGFEKRTDERRGKGTFKKIIDAMSYLKEEGVIFGASLTATRDNAEELTSDEFLDMFFDELGASYIWMFQYMPIGRGPTFDMMITPEQREQLWHRERYIQRERGIFVIDFWNGGPISDGCISAGRKGGYLYIDWYGNVMPCVFVPYSVGNIKTDFFDKGKNVDDILKTPFFKGLRKWQLDQGYKDSPENVKNEIVPCPIRDHHDEFNKIVKENNAIPVGKTTEVAFEDERYIKDLTAIGKKTDKLTNGIWVQEYLKM